ncbi:unnamed protein product [Penicillium manginii]
MKSTVLTFCSLADLVDRTHSDSPFSQCAYLVQLGSPCKFRMRHETSNQAKLVVEKYLDILIGPSETSKESIPQFRFLQELATIQLCNKHKKHHSHVIGQWLNEFTAKQASIILRLAKYYNLRIEDTVIGESQESDDEDDEQNLNVTEEGDTLEEDDEEISIVASQSSSSLIFIRRTAIRAEDEVAKSVTRLLQQPIEKESQNSNSGWIYIISPLAMPGKFKVGHTTQKDPQLRRFPDHKRCHGEFKVLVTKLVPYAFRVEQLILKELYNQQLGKKFHREIVGVDQEILLRCFEKWVEFVESCPYSNLGVLTKEAKEALPRPALKIHLSSKPTSRRSTGSTPRNKEGSQSSPSTPSKTNLKVPTSAQKNMRAHYTEPDQDDSGLSSMIANLHLTPSKSERDSSPKKPRYSIPGSFD